MYGEEYLIINITEKSQYKVVIKSGLILMSVITVFEFSTGNARHYFLYPGWTVSTFLPFGGCS